MMYSDKQRRAVYGRVILCFRMVIAFAACHLLCGCLVSRPEEVAPTAGVSAFDSAGATNFNTIHNQHQVAVAASLMHAGRHEAAQKQLVEILATCPADSSAVELLADVSEKLGDYRLEQASLKRLAALQPGSATVANRCGKRLLKSARIQTATGSSSPVEFSQQGVDKENNINGSVDDSDLFAEETRKLALASLENAVNLEPRNTLFAQELFAALVELGMNERAERVLHEALQRNPQDKVLPMSAARLYESKQDWSSAVFYYDVALRNDPANPVWRRQRAVCHFRQGAFEKARTDFSRSLAGSPVKPQLSEHLAWAEAALKTEDHEEAAHVLELIVSKGELRTADIEVLRGACLLKQGKVQAAAEVVIQAQLEWPRHAGLWQLSKQIKAVEQGEAFTQPEIFSLDLACLTIPQLIR